MEVFWWLSFSMCVWVSDQLWYVACYCSLLECRKADNGLLELCQSILIYLFLLTRSYAALRAADLDWIIGPGYSSGGYILGENHEKPEASPPDSRLSNSRSSGEDGEPPSPSDEGDGPRRSPSPNRRAPAPPRRPHQDVPSRRTVEPVSRKKSHWLISLFVFQYHFFAKVIDWFLCLCFNIISLQNQI